MGTIPQSACPSRSTSLAADTAAVDAEPAAREHASLMRCGHFYVLLVAFAVWAGLVCMDFRLSHMFPAYKPAPNSAVHLSHVFGATAYACTALVSFFKLIFERTQARLSLHLLGTYISLTSSISYTLLSLNIPTSVLCTETILFMPIRWALYCASMPAIWAVLYHISQYTFARLLYVFWLNWVMLIAGGMSTIPNLSWPHRVYWMTLACVPFPEVCYHMWRMITDAITPVCSDFSMVRALCFVRVFGLLAYQCFPAIFFSAVDGVLPIAVSEPIWGICDWCLKMVMTSSLMETNYLTVEQRHEGLLQKHLESEQHDSIVSLSAAIQEKDDFLSAISHELWSPLNDIISLASSLLSGSTLVHKPEVVQTLTVIMLSGKRLMQLICDILDAARLSQDTIKIKHEQVDMKALVADVAMISSPLVRNRVNLRLDLRPVPLMVGDQGRIVQVLYNLVGNACKFTTEGTVLIKLTHDAAIDVICVMVADTGCGIPRHCLRTIFNPYEQGDASTSRNYGGTGLGLHLVKELVRAHRGIVEVRSIVGHGSTFMVKFPILPDRRLQTVRSSEDTGEQSQMRGRTIQILPEPTHSIIGNPIPHLTATTSHMHFNVPEDEAPPLQPTPAGPNVNVLYHGERHGCPLVLLVGLAQSARYGEVFSLEGFETTWVESGNEAVSHLASAQLLPDVVVMSSKLPDMPGTSLLKQLRKTFPFFALPLFYLSAESSPECLCLGLQAGASDFVPMSTHPQELIWRVRNHLEARSKVRKNMLRPQGGFGGIKMSLLPFMHRHSMSATRFASDAPSISRTYEETAIVHITIDSTDLIRHCCSHTGGQPSLLHQVHMVIHQKVTKSPLVILATSVDSWTCMMDTDASMKPLGLNQFCAEVMLHLKHLRERLELPVLLRMGLAFGKVATALLPDAAGCQLIAMGAPVEIAAQIADAVDVDTCGVMCAPDTPGSRRLSVPGLERGTSDVSILEMSPQEMYRHIYIGPSKLKELEGLHPIFPALLAARAAVVDDPTSSVCTLPPNADIGDVVAMQSGGSCSMNSPQSRHTSEGGNQGLWMSSRRSLDLPARTPPSLPQTSQSQPTNALSARSRERTSLPPQPEPAAATAATSTVIAATRRLVATGVNNAVVADMPSLNDIAKEVGISLPYEIALRNVEAATMAFVTAEELPALGLFGAGGLALLAKCKRTFTMTLLNVYARVSEHQSSPSQPNDHQGGS